MTSTRRPRRHARPGAASQIKGVLRDQTMIAGVGNAYSDEVLHAAKISPFKLGVELHPGGGRPAARRDRGPRSRERGGRARQAWPRRTSRARRRPACACTAGPASPVRSAATRSARCPSPTPSLQYCPTCQTGGKPLADRRMSRLLKLSKCALGAAASREEPPPHRAGKTPDPGGDASADRPAALVHRALTLAPDNAHQIPLRFRGIAAALAAGH